MAVISQGCGGGADTQGAAGPENPTSDGEPKAVSQVHVVPPVLADETPRLICDVPVINDSAKSVRFTTIRHSCGCTTAELGERTLSPGQKTNLHLEVNLQGRSGSEKFACVLLDEEGNGWVHEIRTTVYPGVAFTPREIRFGLVDPNGSLTDTSEIAFHARDFGQIPDLQRITLNLSEGLTVNTKEAVDQRLADGICVRKIPLEVIAKSGPHPGPVNGYLSLIFDDKGIRREERSFVSWTVRSLFEIAPARAFFTPSDIDEGKLQRRIRIKRTDGIPFKVRRVTASDPAIRLPNLHLEEEEVKELDLLVELDAGAMIKSPLWGELFVLTDHPLQPLVKVPFAAFKN